MARLVHLRHPDTGGECKVPESTAEVLMAPSRGWVLAEDPEPTADDPPARDWAAVPTFDDSELSYLPTDPTDPEPTDLETEVHPESEED